MATLAMLLWSPYQIPSFPQIPIIVFCFRLSEALAWKNLVFLSPSLSQCDLEHWPQYISSLSRRSLISFLNWFISPPKDPPLSIWIKELSFFLLSWITFGICPKAAELQALRLAAQAERADAIPFGELKSSPEHQAASIISLHSSFFVHIDSKWKRRARRRLGALGSDKTGHNDPR